MLGGQEIDSQEGLRAGGGVGASRSGTENLEDRLALVV